MHVTKMHGAGNSFLLTEDLRGELTGEDLSVLARRLCDPSVGPGADGLIVLGGGLWDADLTMRFFNNDGSRGEMCGNGARCAARYGAEHGLVRDPGDIRILAEAGPVRARRLTETLYEVRLNDPTLIDRREAEAGGETVPCFYTELGMPGLPHAVVEVDAAALDELPRLRERGRALRFSPAFPKGANVSFAALTGPRRARAVTYERGVEDFTLSCGTGAGSTALALRLLGVADDDSVQLDFPGGELLVSVLMEDGEVTDIYLTGPAVVVAEGEYIGK